MANKLTLAVAQAVVDAILAAAAERKVVMAAAVADAGGELVCLKRMDGGTALNSRMAFNKAYTAVKWQRDTKTLKERMFDMNLGDERREMAWFGDLRFTPVWGGIVLRADDGTVLGALGESGGTPAQDEEAGQIGARAFAAFK
ncbi:MAG: heme-binding protein [Reyranellaceae bacterium]